MRKHIAGGLIGATMLGGCLAPTPAMAEPSEPRAGMAQVAYKKTAVATQRKSLPAPKAKRNGKAITVKSAMTGNVVQGQWLANGRVWSYAQSWEQHYYTWTTSCNIVSFKLDKAKGNKYSARAVFKCIYMDTQGGRWFNETLRTGSIPKAK